jgi:hypothetical protein
MITFLFIAVLAVVGFLCFTGPDGLPVQDIVTEEKQAKLHREEF